MEQIDNDKKNNKNGIRLTSSLNPFNEYDKDIENKLSYLNQNNQTNTCSYNQKIHLNNSNEENKKKCNIF